MFILMPDRTPDFRVFAKINLAANAKADDASLRLKLRELFSDFNYENRVFFRAGETKRAVGSGLFFSPADVISAGRIDPQDPPIRNWKGPLP